MVRPIPNTALTIWAGLELGCSEQIRYAEAVDLRSTDPTDDVWNFEQLQREKAMLTEEVARLAQACEAARAEKTRLASSVQEKDRKIAFLYEEKDMLLQVRIPCHCDFLAAALPG